jgi:coenzyme F420-dependent glucose-6-phosphate dehydrogenase
MAEERGLELGYFLSSEEHAPSALVTNAAAAQAIGFRSAMISDHIRAWTPTQGNAPFIWGVLGAISQAAPGLEVGTGVSAAVHRIHPVTLAHAAATASLLLGGRFFLGLGTGERLNEQVTGERWPRAGERRKALEEALPLVRKLLAGRTVNHRGPHVTLERARLDSVPASVPPILVAAGGKRTARLAGELADGMVGVAPDPSLVEAFEAAGGEGKPRFAQLKVCWAPDREQAVATARRWFPTEALPSALLSELATPDELAAAAELVDDARIADAVVCGPDVEPVVAAVRRLVATGFTRVYLHQVGPDQAGFLSFVRQELVAALGVDLADTPLASGRPA